MLPGSSSISLVGKRVLITGGTTGVGRASALLFAGAGCRLVICGRDSDHLADALQAIRDAGGEVHGVSADVGKADDLIRVFQTTDQTLGGVDIVILNAAVGAHGELTAMPAYECRELIDINLTAVVCCAREAMRRMRTRGGHIVIIGSMSAEVFEEFAAVYVATKAGVRGFANSLRKEANPLGVKVSVVEPGTIGSDMVDESPGEQQRMIAEKRMLRAEDVARSIHFIVTQPAGCDVIRVQLRPHLQLI